MAALLEVRGIEKRYGVTRALRGVDLRLDRGEVLSLLGENGAGKSTLVKILSGVIAPDAGEVVIDGEPVRFSSPRDALSAGIAYIPQELSAVGPMTVAENLVLGSWPSRLGLTSRRSIMRRARAICEKTGIPLPLQQTASTLRLSDLQELEISKALGRDARIILLDEPTAALSAAESRHLFDVVAELTRKGVAIIFVSHRLDEVSAISDRVAVLRNGACAAVVPGAEATREVLVQHMVGSAVDTVRAGATGEFGAPLLELRSLTADAKPPVSEVSFTARVGEVVGLYGIRGSGLSTVADALGGTLRRATGTIAVGGRPHRLPRSPRAARSAGIVSMPPDRKRGGLFPNLSVAANISTPNLGSYSWLGLLLSGRERGAAREILSRLEVKVRNERQNVMALSGGNQQKILIASRMSANDLVLIANEPSRGVDVGARRAIHTMLRDFAADGRTVVVLSSDVEEIVNVADRVLVMRDGEIVGELSGEDRTEANAIAVAAGGTLHDAVPARPPDASPATVVS